jgi:hypothetical protein
MAVFPLAHPVFRPAMQVITAIATAYIQNLVVYTVTTGQAHQYLPGLTVRLDIPLGFGMQNLSGTALEIITIPTPTTFTVAQIFDLSTQNDPFVVANMLQQAQSVPVSENVFQVYQAVANVIPTGVL